MRIALVLPSPLTRYRTPAVRALSELPDCEVCVFVPSTFLGKASPQDDSSSTVGARDATRGRDIYDLSAEGFRQESYRLRSAGVGSVCASHSPGLRQELGREGFDVVVAVPLAGFLTGLSLALAPVRSNGRRLPVVWWFSGWIDPNRNAIVVRTSHWLVSRALRAGDAIAAYGSRAAARAIEMGVPPEKVFVAQNAVDTAGLERAADELRQVVGRRNDGELHGLYVGQISAGKRLDWAIAALSRGPETVRGGVRLRFVGGGSHAASLQRLAEELGVEEQVEWFPGTFDDGELGEHIAWADVGVLPARGGLMLNSLMSCGVPVVCGIADGTEEDLVRDGITGWRIEGEGPEALARALDRVILDRDRLAEVGHAARALVHSAASLGAMVRALRSAAEFAVGQDEPDHEVMPVRSN